MRNSTPLLKSLWVAAAVFLMPASTALAAGAADVGEQIADALNEQDLETMYAVIDIDSLARTLSGDLGLSSADAKAFHDGLRKGMRRNLDTGLRQFTAKGGVAKYVRTGNREGKPFALVRVEYTGDEGGFDYVEYYLSPGQQVEDWYTHSRGSRASTSMRLAMSSMLKKDSMLTALFGVKAVNDSEVKRFREFNAALAAGDLPKAYLALDGLPESYRQTRDWAMLRASIAAFDERAYRAALEHLAKNFGNDSSVQFMLIDHYYYQERFDLAHQAVTVFETSIGGEDAVTNFLKCSSLISWRRYDDAVKACRRGIELEADFQPAYWGVVTAGLQSKNPKLALSGLSAYEKAFKMEFDPDRLAQLDEYRDLGRTPEFAAWAKSRRGDGRK
jgi:tetratricopeptide (TPR) repeat protein